MKTKSVHLHGPGRAGTSLALLLVRSGWTVSGLSGGSERGAAAAQTLLGPNVPWTPDPPEIHADLLLIAAPDDRLAAAVATLVPRYRSGLAVHVSGICGLEVLNPLRDIGARIGALHPLRSFPTRDPGPSDLSQALVAIEAAPEVALELEAIARDLGGRPFRLTGDARGLYHLGAATMGNAILAMAAFAEEALVKAGVPTELARSGLAGLAAGALANFERHGAAAALSGPLARGDVSVLDRHLALVAACLPERRGLHWELQRALLELTDNERSHRWFEEHDR